MQAGACTLFKCTLLQVAEVLNGDVGDSGHSRDVVGDGDVTGEHGSDERFVVSLGELAVFELRGSGRDLDVVLFRVGRDEAQGIDLAAVVGKVAGHDFGEQMLDGGSKALHCGGNGHAFAVIAVDDAGLVNVDADDLAADLEKIRQLSQDSDGAFDPTLGKIIRLWNIDGENPHVPDQSEIDTLLPEVGYEKIQVDGNNVTLLDGCTLDLGAVGKGMGCDQIMDYLQTQPDVFGMILNLGGSSVMTYGEKPDGSPWKVALTDPRDTEGDYLGAITLDANQFLSTSGDYEKYFIEDGIRYHHILDPKTGYPVQNGLTSVTIVCDQGYLADGLSTACFVLGMDAAKPLLEKYGAEAVFVDEDKNVYVTSGLMDKFELMKGGYTVNEA